MQLRTRYSLFRNLLCSTAYLLKIEPDRISVAHNTFGVTQAIALDALNVFWHDRAYYWSLHKTKLHCAFSQSFLNRRRLRVVSKQNSTSSKCVIKSGINQNSTLVYLFFFASNFSLRKYCVRLLSELIILLSTQLVTKHLTCLDKLRCNLISKIKLIGKYSYSSSTTFWFCYVKICYLKSSLQDQTLQAAILN